MLLGMIKYHLTVLFREPMNMFFGLGLPFLQLFLLSGNFEGGENQYFLDVALPMFVTIAVMVLCFMDSAMSHAYSRQIKFLRRLRMTPVKPTIYILSGVFSRLAVLFAFVAIFLTVTVLAFDFNIGSRNWVAFIGVLILTFGMFYLIGMFFANVLKNAKTSQSVLYVVFFGLLLLGNAFFPIDAMPEAVQTIAQNTPTVHAMNLLQSAWLDTGLFYGHNFIAVAGITIVFGLLSIKFFKYE
jgi:ABC-2 type transport system permease protein